MKNTRNLQIINLTISKYYTIVIRSTILKLCGNWVVQESNCLVIFLVI